MLSAISSPPAGHGVRNPPETFTLTDPHAGPEGGMEGGRNGEIAGGEVRGE